MMEQKIYNLDMYLMNDNETNDYIIAGTGSVRGGMDVYGLYEKDFQFLYSPARDGLEIYGYREGRYEALDERELIPAFAMELSDRIIYDSNSYAENVVPVAPVPIRNMVSRMRYDGVIEGSFDAGNTGFLFCMDPDAMSGSLKLYANHEIERDVPRVIQNRPEILRALEGELTRHTTMQPSDRRSVSGRKDPDLPSRP